MGLWFRFSRRNLLIKLQFNLMKLFNTKNIRSDDFSKKVIILE
jgi:hypothetical protein